MNAGGSEGKALDGPQRRPSTGKKVRHFTTAVFDMVPLPDNWRDGTPSKDDLFYYYRTWKTILTRTTSDGGQSYFIHSDHRVSIPNLWHAPVNEDDSRTLEESRLPFGQAIPR